MIITANKNFKGTLQLTATINGKSATLSLKPGQAVTVDNQWYAAASVQSAIRAGYIVVTNYVVSLLGENTTKITVSSTAPKNPLIGDLWFVV